MYQKLDSFFLGASVRALKTPVLNMTGDHSPHVEATVAFNGRLQPNKCTWMKIQVHIYQIFSMFLSSCFYAVKGKQLEPT